MVQSQGQQQQRGHQSQMDKEQKRPLESGLAMSWDFRCKRRGCVKKKTFSLTSLPFTHPIQLLASNKMPDAGYFVKKRGQCGSQFLKFESVLLGRLHFFKVRFVLSTPHCRPCHQHRVSWETHSAHSQPLMSLLLSKPNWKPKAKRAVGHLQSFASWGPGKNGDHTERMTRLYTG